MNEYFYCYSKKLSHFIMAYDIPYVSKSVNKKMVCHITHLKSQNG